jgi:hypothetical protein
VDAPTPCDLGLDPPDRTFIADPDPVDRRLGDDDPIPWNPAIAQWVVHHCLGAPPAGLELGIAFETLLHRAPRLELVEPSRRKPTPVLRGLEPMRART